MSFEIDDIWTRELIEQSCQSGGLCANQIVRQIQRGRISGMAGFNGTYDIGYYRRTGPTTWVAEDPFVNPCGFWFFPTITRTIRYFAEIETITGDPNAPCAYSRGTAFDQNRTATLQLAAGAINLNSPVNANFTCGTAGLTNAALFNNYTGTESRSIGCGTGFTSARCSGPSFTESVPMTTNSRADIFSTPGCQIWVWNYLNVSPAPVSHVAATVAGQAGFMVPSTTICRPTFVEYTRQIDPYSDTKASGSGVSFCLPGSPQNTRTVQWDRLKWTTTVTLNA